jgi:hypothetical protein
LHQQSVWVPGEGIKTQSGGVAQLGERRLCKPEVIGSIPFASTNTSIIDLGKIISLADGANKKFAAWARLMGVEVFGLLFLDIVERGHGSALA